MHTDKLIIDAINRDLEYDPKSGVISWKSHVINKRTRVAGNHNDRGYLCIYILQKRLLAHRVAWVLHCGSFPYHGIDHINGVIDDNRICNLRDVPHYNNQRNKRLHKNNTSGFHGVRFERDRNTWRASIGINGKCIKLGSFPTKSEAITARLNSELKYNVFHKNHGKAHP